MEAARPASLADGPQVTAMRAAFAAHVRGLRGGAELIAERTDTQASWATWVAAPERRALVGTLDDHVVGYALVRSALRAGTAHGVVEEVWVDPEARGVGVGEALMAAAVEWCRGAGCDGVDAVALPGDRVMKGFFEQHGLTARLLVMHRRLGDVPESPRP